MTEPCARCGRLRHQHPSHPACRVWVAADPPPAACAAPPVGDAPARPPPTHRCKLCGALWRLNEWPFDWTLYSSKAGPCCDNRPMGDQIEPITGFRRLCDPGPMGEPAPSPLPPEAAKCPHMRERISLPKEPRAEPTVPGECSSRECDNWPMYHFRTRACPPAPASTGGDPATKEENR